MYNLSRLGWLRKVGNRMKRLVATAALAAALLLPATPAGASDGPIAGVRECPSPYIGVIVYHVDYNTGGPVDLVALCIPVGE